MSSWLIFISCLLLSCVNIIQCNIPSEIKKSNTPFTNATINFFIELVNKNHDFDMIDVRSYPSLRNYRPIPGNKSDIQILYSDAIESGYYVCVYYNPDIQTVYIYDGGFENINNTTNEKHNRILKKRYPKAKRTVIVVPKTEQYDQTSSGPLVIAYATTLILGKTPATYGFRMNVTHQDKAIHLRNHIYKMFENGKLSLFPRSPRLDLNYIADDFDNIKPDILYRVRTPHQPLHMRTIMLFNKLVEATTGFYMVSTLLFHNYPELVPVHNPKKNDVQILFLRQNQGSHAICIYYEAANETVYVYEDERADISSLKSDVIERRYPKLKRITFGGRKAKQTDPVSCGLYSIAYATTLILGHDPKTYDFRTTPYGSSESGDPTILREHILNMFKSKQLSLFPSK